MGSVGVIVSVIVSGLRFVESKVNIWNNTI